MNAPANATHPELDEQLRSRLLTMGEEKNGSTVIAGRVVATFAAGPADLLIVAACVEIVQTTGERVRLPRVQLAVRGPGIFRWITVRAAVLLQVASALREALDVARQLAAEEDT